MMSILCAIPLLSLADVSLTNADPQCPSIAALQRICVSRHLYPLPVADRYQLYVYDRFQTTEKWQFKLGLIAARDEDEAYKKALASLHDMTTVSGPIFETKPGKQTGHWVCHYPTSDPWVWGTASYPEF